MKSGIFLVFKKQIRNPNTAPKKALNLPSGFKFVSLEKLTRNAY